MWIDASHCTKPCSVVISRISTTCKPCVPDSRTESTEEEHSSVVKPKKIFRTSFERYLLIKSGITGQERKSSRLHGPKSRLRSRKVVSYSKKMPAPVKKDCVSSQTDDRQKTTLSSMHVKSGEWQKSTSLNSFKLRLKCLNKEKPKRKWTLQNSKAEDVSKPSKEDTSSKLPAAIETDYEKVKTKNENIVIKKHNHQTVTSKSLSSTAKHMASKMIKSDKKPLSKLVISCNKAYRQHQAMLGKPVGMKTKAEPKQEEAKIHKKMTAYTVYTKLRENSIESINCKRYKKRKDIKRKPENCFRVVRETNSANYVSELSNHKNDGSVEADVRATLDSLLKDVVSAELDDLLSLEAPTPEIRDLLRVFCKQYGYNYDKDFADIQNSVLNFKIADSTSPCIKKPKGKSEVLESEEIHLDGDLKTAYRKNQKRRRKRKRDSPDESDEEECPEIMSAVMRSRSKDRRNRLSLQSNRTASETLVPKPPKRHRKLMFPTGRVRASRDDSEMDVDVSLEYSKAVLHSPSEEVTKSYSDDNEETDCGDLNDHNVSGHMYIPPLSSEESSEEEELRTDNSSTKAFEEDFNTESSEKEPCDNLLSNTVLDKSTEPVEIVNTSLPSTSCVSASDPQHSLDLSQGKPVAASMPSIDSLFRTLEEKSENAGVGNDSSAVGVVNSEDTLPNVEKKNKRPETPIRSFSVGSPDTDWESDKLVICLDQDENSSAAEAASTEPHASPDPVREILYHTPKLPIDSRVSELLRVTNSAPVIPSFTPTFVQNGEVTAAESTHTNSRTGVVSPQRTESTTKEAQGTHLLSKHHRTPVQKVFPQVKSLNPTLLNNSEHHQNHPRRKGLATVHPKPQLSVQAIAPDTLIPQRSKDLPTLSSANEHPHPQPIPVSTIPSSTASITTPLLNQIAPTVCVPPLPLQIPSPVPIQTLPSTRVPSLAVVPVVSPPAPVQATSNQTPNAITIPLTRSTSPLLTGSLPIASDQDPHSRKMQVSVTDVIPRNRTVDAASVPQVPSSIPQLNSQNALDISILRSLLLDPPPEDIQSNEIHNLILQKAKELEDKEELQDSEFNMPVISNVVSLKEEALKKGTEVSGFNTAQKASQSPKTSGSEQEPFPDRISDSPEIVEEKLKSTTNLSKHLSSNRTNTVHGETFSDVLRNLQLEIKNLEKMAEEKKKEYFLIMYVRNFKRDTLRRLHESLQAKISVSHTSKMANACTPVSEPSHTPLKETCLVRPMVQIQPHSTPLSPPQINRSPEPQKDIRIVNTISDSQAKSRSFSPDQRRAPGGNTAALNSSLAALAKVESDHRTGFRTYLSQTGSVKDPSSPKISDANVNISRSSFSKYQPLIPHVKSSLQIPEAHQKSTVSATMTLSPSASSATPPQITTSSVNYNPGLSTWKGTVSAYLQKSKSYAGKSDFSTVPSAPPPPYANTVKNLLKQSSTSVTNSGVSPVSSLAKDYSKGAENLNSPRAHVTQGPAQLSQPPFLDFYPFHGPGAPNNYLQANPFWPAASYTQKHNSSLASLQAARDLYMNSLTLGAWRTARNPEAELEKLGDKTSSENMWTPVSGSAQSRHAGSQKEAPQNLVTTNRPFHYGLLRKCVVCKVADAQFICSGCGKDWYCSVSCQRQNWKIHSRSCVSSTT